MRLVAHLMIAGLLSAACFGAAEVRPNSAHAYRNPLLPDRELADPDVIHLAGKYYLYATSDAKGYEVFTAGWGSSR